MVSGKAREERASGRNCPFVKGTLRSSKAHWVLFGFVHWQGLDLLAMTFQCQGGEEPDCPALRTGWEVRKWRQPNPLGLEEGKDSA